MPHLDTLALPGFPVRPTALVGAASTIDPGGFGEQTDLSPSVAIVSSQADRRHYAPGSHGPRHLPRSALSGALHLTPEEYAHPNRRHKAEDAR